MASVRHLGLFPFCVGTYPPMLEDGTVLAVGGGSQFPFAMPINLCTRLWWTVKEFKISFTYSLYLDAEQYENLSPGSFSETQATNIVVYTQNGTQVGYVNIVKNTGGNEKNLVCFRDWLFAGRSILIIHPVSRTFVITGPGTPSSGTTVDNMTIGLGTNSDNQGAGATAPFAAMDGIDMANTANLWTALQVEISPPFNSFRSYSLDNMESDGSGVFKFLGRSFSFPTYRFPPGNGITQTISNLVIEPSEFWPYDPGDGGGPIYDSATGAQLRAFPST